MKLHNTLTIIKNVKRILRFDSILDSRFTNQAFPISDSRFESRFNNYDWDPPMVGIRIIL